MSRFNEIEIALVERLRALKAKPGRTINLLDVSTPLNAAGYERDEILDVLSALEQDGILAFAPADRLRIVKPLPD
ncbi:hypothetical protein GAO09_03520 [Rhizobiales bacterium RZME27]|uniref:Uncharacterized protein n=1 Tax=Endobacterium cereale TaxID=2663029 RepID=A0A6A8A325_9HYPH|nr:hypothetical protein [Endobacterium cereale]MEB2844544.1 hypothetical protein [Endobacterium cereale]MQY45139.1 hypothetical protein [Endobacterium cereale]